MTIHWTSWKEALNACAKVGKPTLAMLVPSEDSNMDNERLVSAQRIAGVRCALAATARFNFIMSPGSDDSGNGAIRNLRLRITGRKAHHLHCIRAFNAIPQSRHRFMEEARPLFYLHWTANR
jgi:hypothetical protein